MDNPTPNRNPGTRHFIIKLCGITQSENLAALSALPIDWFGFICYPKSKRFVKNPTVLQQPIKQKKAAVFVGAPLEEVKEFTETNGVDMVQLHGHESVAYCEQLKDRGLVLIKAFSVHDNFDFNQCKEYETACDYFIFDTRGKLPGGNGIQFNWAVLRKYEGPTPFLLSGGIGMEQIAALRSFSHPFWRGIDLNSRFETTPGVKDVEKVAHFLKNKNQFA